MPDEKLDFTVQISDADADTASGSFFIGIDGTGPFDDNQVTGVNAILRFHPAVRPTAPRQRVGQWVARA